MRKLLPTILLVFSVPALAATYTNAWTGLKVTPHDGFSNVPAPQGGDPSLTGTNMQWSLSTDGINYSSAWPMVTNSYYIRAVAQGIDLSQATYMVYSNALDFHTINVWLQGSGNVTFTPRYYPSNLVYHCYLLDEGSHLLYDMGPSHTMSFTNPVVACNNSVLNMYTDTATRVATYNGLGFRFTVGSSNLTVCSLSRISIGTSVTPHPIEILTPSGILYSNTIPPSGNGLVSLDTPLLTLTNGQPYAFIVFENTTDTWLDNHTITNSAAVNTVMGVYRPAGQGPPTRMSDLNDWATNTTYSTHNFNFK